MNKLGSSWDYTKVFDWKNYMIPARPSASELDIIEGYIRKIKKARHNVKVLILGSTVEFRSLCHKHKLNVTVMDFNKKFYKILSRQPMEYKGKERLREEDWRTMSIKKKYDMILGDLVLNVCFKRDLNNILRNVSMSLSDNGICIIRTWVRWGDRRYETEAVIAEHRKKRPRTHIYTSIIMPLYMCFNDFKGDTVDYKRMINGMKEQLKKGNITKGEFFRFYNRWKREGSAFTISLKENVERLKSRYFEIKEIRYGKDCFRHWAPIYILEKKKHVRQ